jgi:hypothetical protein
VAEEEAANVDEYGLPTLAAGRLAVVIETVAAGGGTGFPPPEPLIVIVNWRCASEGRHQSADGGFWSLRFTQNDQLPAEVGVPPTWPLDAKVKPGGSEPEITLN